MKISEGVIDLLAREVPVSRDLLERHQEIYGSILKYVYLGEVARWIVDSIEFDNEASEQTAERVLEVIGRCYERGDSDEHDLMEQDS